MASAMAIPAGMMASARHCAPRPPRVSKSATPLAGSAIASTSKNPAAELASNKALDAKNRLRWVDEATADQGNVAQPDQSPVRDEVDIAQVILRLECAGDSQQQLLIACLD